jgi:hypothetical protein
MALRLVWILRREVEDCTHIREHTRVEVDLGNGGRNFVAYTMRMTSLAWTATYPQHPKQQR